ncbi:MAG: GNAT family N-acetyltransferase [Parafilimonas sp.]|nr:GNAT family N-acetyltransferase [Parafilimonas sp.]
MPDIMLRPWKKEDARQLAYIANNKNIWNNLRDSIPFPYAITDAEKWIAHCNTQNPVVNFAIIYKSALAGSIGSVLKADVYRKNIEIGYFIGEAYWNLGIATQAVHILVDHIEKEFDVVRLYAEVYAHNKASMKVLRNNGFYLESIRRKSAVKNNILLDDYIWVKILDK